MIYEIKTLTNIQYNTLNQIASRTKMDCWFDIRQNESFQDYVFDLEEIVYLDLRDGIIQLIEGLDCIENYQSCNLNCIEEYSLWDMCQLMKIPLPDFIKPKIHKGISSEDLISLLKSDNLEYELIPDLEDGIICHDYAFKFDCRNTLFNIVNLFYVEVR